MPHVVWSPRAIADVRRLDRFLREKSPDAASRAAAAIDRRALFLAEFPEAGRRARTFGPPYRELGVNFGSGGYVILYRYVDGHVTIAAVRHMREAGYQP